MGSKEKQNLHLGVRKKYGKKTKYWKLDILIVYLEGTNKYPKEDPRAPTRAQNSFGESFTLLAKMLENGSRRLLELSGGFLQVVSQRRSSRGNERVHVIDVLTFRAQTEPRNWQK